MTLTRNLLQPFAAVTPPRHMAHLVASRSYLSYSPAELQDKLRYNPYSYIQVINPDVSRAVKTPRGSVAFFDEVKLGYQAFKSQGWLEESPEAEWYLYRQSSPSHSCTGMVCTLNLELCGQGGLKTHEQTLKARETLFASFLERTGFHAEPILCARTDDDPSSQDTDHLFKEILTTTPHTDFTTTDGIRHEIWRISAASDLGSRLTKTCGKCETLYLADGHHRLASSQHLAETHPELPGTGQILAYVVPEKDLVNRGFQKEITEVNLTVTEFESALHNMPQCQMSSLNSEHYEPSKPGNLVVHFQEKSWKITRSTESKEVTDADFIDVHLLKEILGIQDARNDIRLEHLPETARPNQGWNSRAKAHPDRVLIVMHPIPFGQVRQVADQNSTLPPKSTWIEPKIRSALFIYEFES